MSERRRTNHVVDQKEALSVYFDALLREPLEEASYEEVLATQEISRPVVIAPPLIAPPVVQTETQVDTEVEATGEPLPSWAAAQFQALLFRVAGLTLAVPLAELSGIQEWDDEAVTPMLGRIPWYLGLMEYRGRQMPVVDTAQLVLPPDRLASLMEQPEERLSRVVFIGDGRWGLACDEVAEVITLRQDQVKWRSSRTKRRWLAGTVIEHMCAIIDPPAFAEMLATGIEDQTTTDGS